LSFLPGRDVPRIVDYAVGQGKQRFGALIPQTPYGRIAEQFFRQAVTSRGATIVALERFPPDANGMLEPAQKIAALAQTKDPLVPPQVDAIFIPTGPESLPTLSALIPYNEIDTSRIQLFGTGRWDYANIGKEKPLVGGWYPAPDPKGWRTFTQRYVKTYEKTPPRLASLAYDAVSLAVTLSSNEPGNRYTAAQLTRSSGFAGVDGLFRLRRDGLTDRGLAILEVQKFDSRVIDPAPSGFNTGPVQAAARQGQ
jgi:ABC-type branched-subunit amino acid transport system substrate-binding protein